MNRLSASITLFISAGLFALGAADCFAENADRNKPINLEADHVIVDDAKQISLFTGNVLLTQGTLKIHADRLTVTQSKDGFSLSTATGQPASFRQKREGASEFIEGSAESIEYDTRNETIDLKGLAQVKRTADEVRGNHISYSTKTEIFQVHGTSTPDANDPGKGRVRAVIQPKHNESLLRGTP